MLGDLELQQVQWIDVDEREVVTDHAVPSLEGDFLQRNGRRATRVRLAGTLSGPGVAAGLKGIRDSFRAARPISFAADIATATRLGSVLVECMDVREVAGKPERFEYALTLREYIPPPRLTTEQPPPPPPEPTPPPPPIDSGSLVVEVIVRGQPDFDLSTVVVTAQGG